MFQKADVKALISAAFNGDTPKVRKLLVEGVPFDSLNEVSLFLCFLQRISTAPFEISVTGIHKYYIQVVHVRAT